MLGGNSMTHEHERNPEHGNETCRSLDEKPLSIIINGRRKRVDDDELSFDQVVALAFEDPPTGEFICFTIIYRNAAAPRSQGTLIEGEAVKIREETVFNVTVTDKS